MDIQKILESGRKIIEEYLIPNIGTILLIIVGIIAGLFVLRIIFAALWENILVGIIKISDKKTENEKEDEK
ncbi:MAG: hypothetical protein MSA82_08420 [Oscillospiraceae bacterium]|nr:hypothetical protein [Oscillospiraceae bacterium]